MANKNSNQLHYLKFAAGVLALVIGVIYTQTLFNTINQGQLLGESTYLAKNDEARGNSQKDSTDRGNKPFNEELTSEKIKFENRGGKLDIKKELTTGEEIEITDQQVENELEDIDIATDEADTVVFVKDRIGAHSKHPLSIDLATNELIVTTPSGIKRVTVLPQVAVLNMLRLRKIDEIVDDDDDVATDEGELEESTEEAELADVDDVDGTVEIVEENGEIVYEVEGVSNQNLVGIAPVKIKKKLTISSSTGEVINEEVALLQRILDLLSI